MPSPQPSSQHQVESILILARGALLCKGQEGAGRGHVDQGWDPVGDPSLVLLLEQRAAEGARCHFFHDLCKDRRELSVCPHPKACLDTSSALSFNFWRSPGGKDVLKHLFFLYKSNITISKAQSKQYAFSFNKSILQALWESCVRCLSERFCMCFCRAFRGITSLDGF